MNEVPPEIGEHHQPAIYERDQHCLSRRDLDPDALKIMYRLIRNGYKAYLVGGGVRDVLLGKKPKDFDIATDATPRRVKALFRNCRIIGRRFKLAHVYFHGGKIIEVSTFRDFNSPIDVEDDKEREPGTPVISRDNKYGTEETDAVRRDITINALFYDLSSFSIIDYVGGMQDLRSGVVRVIGDPDARFAEDPVRLLRVARHAGRSSFRVEDSCRDSILRNHALIRQSSAVRLYEEIKKDLSSGSVLAIFQLFYELQLLQHFLPEFCESQGGLLASEHAFSSCLKRLDELANSGAEFPVTSVLTLFVLYFGTSHERQPDLRRRFPDHRSLDDQLGSAFALLAVPKKERERIQDTLDLWHLLVNTPIDRLDEGMLDRKRALEEVYWLFEFLPPNQSSHEILSLISSAREHRKRHPRPSGGSRRGGRDRRPQHQRMPGMGRMRRR